MTPGNDQDAGQPDTRLEQLVDRMLSEQPPRTAPPGFESRVLAELERRAALPWWRTSFGRWPHAAQLAFLVVSAGFVKLSSAAFGYAFAALHSTGSSATLAPAAAWLRAVGGVIFSMAQACAVVVRDIPPSWLIAGLALAALLYAAVFALAATAYRTLYDGPRAVSVARK